MEATSGIATTTAEPAAPPATQEATAIPEEFMTPAPLWSSMFHLDSQRIDWTDDGMRINQPKRWRVLTVDGGGLRGVIPAHILCKLYEATNQKPFHETFSVMTGNSVGGLVVVGLNVPDENGAPKYTPHQLKQTFFDERENIFPQSYFNWGLSGPRYPSTGIDTVIKKYMGETKMADLLATEVVCPTYCTMCDDMEYFSKVRSNLQPSHRNDYAWEAVRGTTAAPTYLPAFSRGKCSLIDGFAQNDTVELGLWRAMKLGADPKRTTVISLGTGRVDTSMDTSLWGLLDWSTHLVEVVCKGQSDTAQMVVQDLLGPKQHYRIQPTLEPELGKFDDTDIDRMHRRVDAAEQWIEDNDETFREIVFLCEPRPSDDND